jgi:YHYH protein
MVIPAEPIVGEATDITDDVVGILSNGVLLDSHQQTWAYDVCNGHSDTKHQYHYHIPAICLMESMGLAFADSPSWWINDEGNATRDFAMMADQFPESGPASPVIGFARDGHPIFGPYDDMGDLQRGADYGGDLDECNGKMDSNGKYGYYMTVDPPFAPPCLKGEVGLFTYYTSDIACPSSGINNTVISATPMNPIEESEGPEIEGEDEKEEEEGEPMSPMEPGTEISKTLSGDSILGRNSNSAKEEKELFAEDYANPEGAESALPSGSAAISLSLGALLGYAVFVLTA